MNTDNIFERKDMTNIQDLMKQLHASLVPDKLEIAIKEKLESLQAEVSRLTKDYDTIKFAATGISQVIEQRDKTLAQIAMMKTQKPCAAISRCSLIGASECSCGVNGPCEALTDVYLSAGALPQTSEQCKVSPVSSRGCELGTKGCEVRHTNGRSFPSTTVKKVELDPAGEPKIQMTVLERLAIDVLNNIKAGADGGLIKLSEQIQMDIDVVVMMATVRRIGVQ